MKHKDICRATLCTIVLLSLSFGVMADSSKNFAEVLAVFNTMTGSFEQKILDSDGNELQSTQGMFKVKRPGYFWWHVAPPYEQIVVGTPDSLKVFDPDLEQMTVHRQESYNGTPAWLISGSADELSAYYSISKSAAPQDKNTELVRFELTPKGESDSAFQSLSFSFLHHNKQWMLKDMLFMDKLGQKTQIEVSDLTLNPELAAKAFQFEPPKGTDIIVDG